MLQFKTCTVFVEFSIICPLAARQEVNFISVNTGRNKQTTNKATNGKQATNRQTNEEKRKLTIRQLNVREKTKPFDFYNVCTMNYIFPGISGNGAYFCWSLSSWCMGLF